MADGNKQPKLDQYFQIKNIKSSTVNNHKPHISKNKQKSFKVYRSSSREGSGTQVMISEEQKQQKVCNQLILITAADSIFWHIINSKIKWLLNNYNKDQAIKFIKRNLQFHSIKNVQNLQKIYDKTFWNETLPKLLQLVSDRSQKISGKVQMLIEGESKIINLAKVEILILLAQMFLGIMPKQTHTQKTTFGQLMQVHQNERQQTYNRVEVRIQKLKCIINYFNMAITQKNINQELAFQRTKNDDKAYLHKTSLNTPLKQVKFQMNSFIEDFQGRSIMVDFANQYIGGGVLSNGAVQQQIMFITFPQLIITKLISQKLDDDEAIIIYGAQKYTKYTGYSDTFKCLGPYYRNHENNKKTVIVAIDAFDYSKSANQDLQYNKKHCRREVHKAFTGFQGAQFGAEEDMSICTGRWGCGAFKGNELLKFLIQWISCSMATRTMIYTINDHAMRNQLEVMVSMLIDKDTSDILGIIDEYGKFKKDFPEVELITYIKDFIL